MDRWNARTGRVLLHPLDTIAAVVIAGLSLAPHELRTSDRPALAVLPVLASTLPIALRRAFPIPVLAITQTALLVEALSVGTERGALGLASALAMYTVARHHERSLSLRIALTVAAIQVSAVLVAVLIGRPGTAVDAIPAVVILAGSWALGDNVRTRRAYLASL